MKPTIFRYGIYATITIVVVGLLSLFALGNASQMIQEIAGYLSMLLAMIFVFLGIRHFRDHVNGGLLTFGQGLKIGILIVLIPSIAFGLFDLLYTRVINPTWMDDYYSRHIENLRKTVSPDKLDAAIKKAEQQKELFSNPIMEFLLMAATVFIIGFIVTIISSLALRRSKHAIA